MFKILPFLLLAACAQPATDMVNHQEYDLIITNAQIIDGTGADAFEGDILIKDGVIKKIGKIEPDQISSGKKIDAAGRIVSPGFIDMHAHGNPLETPQFENFLTMGITTINLGQDGGSILTRDLYGWMNDVDEIGTGPNIIHMQGHSTLRQLAEAPLQTGLDSATITQMQTLMNEAMLAGSFGLTTGLEYIPGKFADITELVAIAKPVAKYDGLVQSHIRNEDDNQVEKSIAELLEQGERSGAKVHISHIKIVYANDPSRAGYILEMLQKARTDGIQVTADIYPYTASYTGIGIVFPDWAKAPNNFDEVIEKRREELVEFLREKIKSRNGPESTLFGTDPWTGMTLADVADSLNKPFEDVLIDDIGPLGARAAYFVMNEKVMLRFLQDPYVMIGSDGSPTMQHPRGYGSFARIIQKYVVEDEILNLEEAIRKMSGLSAKTLGLDDTTKVRIPRGFIKTGFAADLLIFDPKNIRDKASYEQPHQLSEGFDWVIVNGIPAYEGGEFTNLNIGKVIRRKVDAEKFGR
ncbi:MAG: hypothetical protein WD059_13090 [Balneolaceae bacterium]